MKLERTNVNIDSLPGQLESVLDKNKGGRLGLLTSIDGSQLITLVLDPKAGKAECWESPVQHRRYPSLTPWIPQTHWFERALFDLFGIVPEHHPRLKHLLLHEAYAPDFHPLSKDQYPKLDEDLNLAAIKSRAYHFLEVHGEGVYELPVGPIHAGCIEPGHFRFSCLGENIMNLEIRLGYVHRGVEKRLTEVPWKKSRFVCEAAAGDTTTANALAHAIAIESLLEVEVSPLAQSLRTLALEIERLAMHIIDVGGLGADIGFLAISSSAGRLRGNALGLGQTLTGSRFLRSFIMPGGVKEVSPEQINKIKTNAKQLRKDLKPVLSLFLDSQPALERMEATRVTKSLAHEFGFVGVAARASGIAYDTRQHFSQGVYPEQAPPIALEVSGDILARERVRISEIYTSLDVIDRIVEGLPSGDFTIKLPEKLPAKSIGCGIVEAFRGELIHLIFTEYDGSIKRYCIKDPSFNNWTAISVAVRNALIADFPLCNKSYGLSYSGNDL